MNKVTHLLLLLLIIGVSTSFTGEPFAGKNSLVIVVDAGHGGKDPGSISHKVQEKKITLAIAKKLGKMLNDSIKGVKVIYTRSTDKFIELHERPKIANRNKADIFISIHCNHSGSSKPYGSETYVMGLHKSDGNLSVAKRENSAVLYEDDYDKKEEYEGFDPNSPEAHIIFSFYQNAFLDQSLHLAAYVEQHLSKRKRMKKSRGVKQAGFLVLWKTAMPSILIETGFISNTKERAYLASSKGQKEVAHSVLKAVKQYQAYLKSIN
jgi:N-acetylmuramoyl-L-alanine amidase